eukprot:5908852-Karenia_brevis.AAC.1
MRGNASSPQKRSYVHGMSDDSSHHGSYHHMSVHAHDQDCLGKTFCWRSSSSLTKILKQTVSSGHSSGEVRSADLVCALSGLASEERRRAASSSCLLDSRPTYQREVYPLEVTPSLFEKEVYPDSQCDQLHHDYNLLPSDSKHSFSLEQSSSDFQVAKHAPILVGSEGRCPPPANHQWD